MTNYTKISSTVSTVLPDIRNSQAIDPRYTQLPDQESGIRLIDLPLNIEDDDYLHRPDDEDQYLETSSCIDLCRPRALLNIGALLGMSLFLIVVFIGFPLIGYFRRVAAETH